MSPVILKSFCDTLYVWASTSLLVAYLANRTLLGTLSPGKDADVVLRRLSPSECFEQDEVVLYTLRLLLYSRDRELSVA